MSESQRSVRPETAAEVAQAVREAVRAGEAIIVVCGGHGPWSHAPHLGVRVELSALDGVEIDGLALDGEDAVVHIGGGALWGDVAERLAADGLAISSGDTASVGVGGLTLGGGIGWMVRAWGLASDQLIGAQIVTAAGEIVEASAEENADLFWALRGGGGNFGIVTRFDFAAHPLDGIASVEIPIAGDAAAMLQPNRWTHVTLIADGHHIAVERDGATLFTLEDREPYSAGHFALRTTKSHLRIRNLTIR